MARRRGRREPCQRWSPPSWQCGSERQDNARWPLDRLCTQSSGEERREGGPRVAEAFIDTTWTVTPTPSALLISELAPSQLNRSNVFPTRLSLSHLSLATFVSAPCTLHHASRSYVKTHLTHRGNHTPLKQGRSFSLFKGRSLNQSALRLRPQASGTVN